MDQLPPAPIMSADATPPMYSAPTPTPKESHTLTYILFLLVGILIGALATWGYQRFFTVPVNTLQQVAIPTNTPTPILTVTPSPTATVEAFITPSTTGIPTPTLDPKFSWKLYSDTKLGYSIKYPQLPNFGRLICEDETNVLYLVKAIQSDPTSIPSCPRDGRYNIEIVAKSGPYTDQDVSQFYDITSKNLTVGGESAVKKTYNLKKDLPPSPASSWYITIRFDKDNIFYEAYTGDKDLEKYLDQMMTTFTFTK